MRVSRRARAAADWDLRLDGIRALRRLISLEGDPPQASGQLAFF
jgi:hypothetical protein